MSIFTFLRRAVAASAALALAVITSGSALAQRDRAYRNIVVDVSPLRAHAGDPTATWVQRELPARLAEALAGRPSPNGAPLTVRVDYLTLGPNTGATIHGGSSPDNISGVAIVGGRQIPVRATTTYQASPVDQTMIEQSNHARVSALTQALAYWIAQGAFF